MHNITFDFRSQATQRDFAILSSMLLLLCTDSELKTGKQGLFCDEFYVNLHAYRQQEHVKDSSLVLSRRQFIDLVKKGMTATVTLTVQTKEGDKKMSRQFFPVTLLDIPSKNKAAICLNYVPDFMPIVGLPPQIKLFGELHEFLRQDINFEEENNDQPV